MPASKIVGCSEAKAMATKQKASRTITKKELAYLLSRFALLTQLPCKFAAGPRNKRPSCAAICVRCDAALAWILADPPGIVLAF